MHIYSCYNASDLPLGLSSSSLLAQSTVQPQLNASQQPLLNVPKIISDRSLLPDLLIILTNILIGTSTSTVHNLPPSTTRKATTKPLLQFSAYAAKLIIADICFTLFTYVHIFFISFHFKLIFLFVEKHLSCKYICL